VKKNLGQSTYQPSKSVSACRCVLMLVGNLYITKCSKGFRVPSAN
jgi:hypothetical protein